MEIERGSGDSGVAPEARSLRIREMPGKVPASPAPRHALFPYHEVRGRTSATADIGEFLPAKISEVLSWDA